MGKSVSSVISRTLTVLLVLAFIVVVSLGYVFRQQISDQIAAERFEPSADIVTLTDRLQLTADGHRIFWASHPTLEASQKFNVQCANVDHSDDGHILGCFTGGRIHLFEIADERLSGIVEVTAAHEQLHAVFSRLSVKDRDELVKKLTQLYAELAPEDPKLAERMSVYADLSQSAFANELHSVLGTEVRELPQWLEAHYAHWFTDRTVILDFFDSYRAVFDELKTRSDKLHAELDALRTDVEKRSEAYDAAVQRFNDDWDAFMRRNNNFEFSDNPAEFYRLRDEFDDRRNDLIARMNALNADIERYEQLRQQLIELSELNHELEQHLDSELAPPAPAPTSTV